MKKRKIICLLVALFTILVPTMAVFTGMDLDTTLDNLRRELHYDYRKISKTQEQLRKKYESQHQQMIDIVKKSNDLSLMLYSQKQDYTFDISYALEKVTKEYNHFNNNRTPYDRTLTKLNIEIDRYARLIESLHRLPPELKNVEIIPESLAYHNDTLDVHLLQNKSLLQQELNKQMDTMMNQTVTKKILAYQKSIPPFILSEEGQRNRDSCLYYASELLKIYAHTREVVMEDSTYYREAWLRMKESYDYAQDYYKLLQENVFVNGQTPWLTILKHPATYWEQAKNITGEKYSLKYVQQVLNTDEINYEAKELSMDNRIRYSTALIYLLIYILSFFVLWGFAALLMLPLYRFIEPMRRLISKEQRRYIALLIGSILFIIISTGTTQDDMVGKSISLMHTFIWLLSAITAALLIRLKPTKLKKGVRNYLPIVFTALFVINCRVLFLPNALLNFIFPPFLLIMTLWQLVANILQIRKSDRADTIIAWLSFGITAIAMLISWAGYIFFSLIILVGWYFQLAVILSIATVWHLLIWYKSNLLDKRVDQYRTQITYVSGPAKEKLLFAATWSYDLVREVIIPLLAIASIPLCVHWALNVFEFNNLYHQLFVTPFIHNNEPHGFRMSMYNVLFLIGLFFLFRYLNKAIHTIWQHSQYQRFLRKNKRQNIRNNEINLSLGDSLISVFVWFTYIYIITFTLQIPTGSLALIAGGLSAGIGLALKDIINNFIYGIQLMGGRLRVGDWIECDGVRGKVTDINYQTTLVETEEGKQVSFLNASLFSKNLVNLTRNNSYELTKITVGIAYGTDVQRVRELLESGLENLKTKDSYGRDIVDPSYGIYVSFNDFGDSSINIAVKQYVLVPERITYTDRARELIYNILNQSGITIPFPQCDVHMIADNSEDR